MSERFEMLNKIALYKYSSFHFPLDVLPASCVSYTLYTFYAGCFGNAVVFHVNPFFTSSIHFLFSDLSSVAIYFALKY